MVKIRANKFSQLMAISVLLSLSGCSGIDSLFDTKARVNYQNNKTIKTLDFPPDLTSPEFDKEFELPSGVTNTVSMRTGGVISRSRVEVPAAQQPQQTSPKRAKTLSTLITKGGDAVLRINDSYPRSLILMDIMLERMGFTVSDRNLAAGIYTAHANGNNATTYQVHIKKQPDFPLVSFTTEKGKALPAAAHMKLLTSLNNAFNR